METIFILRKYGIVVVILFSLIEIAIADWQAVPDSRFSLGFGYDYGCLSKDNLGSRLDFNRKELSGFNVGGSLYLRLDYEATEHWRLGTAINFVFKIETYNSIGAFQDDYFNRSWTSPLLTTKTLFWELKSGWLLVPRPVEISANVSLIGARNSYGYRDIKDPYEAPQQILDKTKQVYNFGGAAELVAAYPADDVIAFELAGGYRFIDVDRIMLHYSDDSHIKPVDYSGAYLRGGFKIDLKVLK